MLKKSLVLVGIVALAALTPAYAETETEAEATTETAASAASTTAADEGMEDKDGNAGWAKYPFFESSDGNFTMDVKSRVQFRYTYEDPEDGDSKGSFRVRRAKFALEGKAYEVWKYKIQAVWSGSSTTLEDAYFQYTRNKMAQLWLGQGKAFFGRQELTSSGKQQFVDRSITSGRFAPGRDQGIGLVGQNDSKTFEYNLGLYNGNGRNQSRDDNDDKMLVGRVVFTPFGEYKLEESSLDYPDSGKLAFGASFLSTTEGANDDITRFGAEFAYKIRGFNTVAEYYTEEFDAGGGSSVDTDGYYLQLGYLFPNKKFELAGRYAVVSPDVPFDADEIETGVAFSYYMKKHNYKLQADFRNLEDEGSNTEDTEIRIQLQLAF